MCPKPKKQKSNTATAHFAVCIAVVLRDDFDQRSTAGIDVVSSRQLIAAVGGGEVFAFEVIVACEAWHVRCKPDRMPQTG
mmetsp:Transcript_70738/g.142444  ORF Transcript_70738/g.142444 Transcript_70738/m.142444 type:complete len:80 (-) Transcript_70738:2482-2721(-)